MKCRYHPRGNFVQQRAQQGALRGKMAVENRLGHTRLARQARGGHPRVASFRKDNQSGVKNTPASFIRGESLRSRHTHIVC